MEFNASLLTLFLVFVFLFLKFQFFKQKNGNLLPGSSGWPMVGETLEYLSSGSKGHPEKFILDRLSKYSSDIFKTHLFGTECAIFTGPTNNKFLFSNENKLVEQWLPKSLEKIFPFTTLSSSKEVAENFRKIIPKIFKPEELQRYVGIIDTIAHHHFDSNWENKERVTVFQLTNRFTSQLSCRLFVSIEEPNHVAKFAETIGLINQGILSIPFDLPGTKFNRGIKASKFIRNELRVIMKQRKVDLAEGKASPTQDILSDLLLTSDENGKFMEEADIADKILGLFIAGQDTVSFACASIVMHLAELPHIYEGVYNEQMEIASKKSEGELLNWNDLKEMKYSWNVACEAMRLTPPLQGAFREAITDFTHNGFSIPKGLKIYWSANSTHKNPEFFPDPQKFDPSRFEGSGPAPYTFVPFGGGPKRCPASAYAKLEILIFMHHLVRRFKWEKVIPDEKIIVNPMPNPEKGLPIRLFPRKAC